MKPFLFFFIALAVCAQDKPALPPDTVVASANGKKITVGDIEKIVQSLPQQVRKNYETNPRNFLEQWLLISRLVEQAEKDNLQDKSPYKEGIAFARMQVLWQAQIEESTKKIEVPAEEQKKAYEARKDQYTQAKLKIIYIPFNNNPTQSATVAKKPLTDKEAEEKAKGLLKQIREGADFVALVKQHSEDPISKAKDGDFGPIRRSDKLPDPIPSVVFALKPGDVSEPVRQPNGFYIFKLIDLVPQPYEEVKDVIFTELKNQKTKEWFDANQKAIGFKVENESFFQQKAPQQAAPPSQQQQQQPKK